MKSHLNHGLHLAVALGLAAVMSGCGKSKTEGDSGSRVETGNRDQVLHLGNKAELQDLDPHIIEGVGEHNVVSGLFESLVTEHPKTLEPVPGVAERWEVSPDGLVYTFHLRPNARWSNGDPVTATDFVNSWRRILTPSLGSKYSYMLYVMKNAEPFNQGKITDFSQVGVKALDDRTLQVTLEHPTGYFLQMVANHYSWWPVHTPTIEKHGRLYERGNRWTRPENFVGNGPFLLADWKPQRVITLKKSPTYWDAASVKLNEINFYPIESLDTEERAFRSGQLHSTYEVPLPKIDVYKKDNPELLRMDPYFGTYMYRMNTTRPHLKDKRVRQALSLAIDRKAIVENVTRGGQRPAFHFTPPDTQGYTSRTHTEFNPDRARQLLAEAGFPDGKGFPPVEILYNTSEAHKAIAEAIQQMWKKELNIDARLLNQEWKVYMDSESQLNYDVSRAGWIGDYPDPSTFLKTFTTSSGNNRTGWSNPEFDRLIAEADRANDPAQRMELFQKAEAILMEEMPLVPIYFYTRVYLQQPSVKNWHPNFMDHHPYKYVYLEPAKQ